jgi:CheY-like chemotaxis protein
LVEAIDGWVMSRSLKHRILVVDDEESIRVVFAQLLQREGYEVATAENGFDALLKLKEFVPDVIISDLNMPKMSGFEFLSVIRRRFPKISVIASSGAYGSRAVPTGVLADAFYAKGQEHPENLLNNVADLIQTPAARARAHQKESAPVWIPRNGKDSNGIPYIVITCTECLRSFPLNVTKEENPEVLETLCLFCSNTVKYIIDFSLSVTSPPPGLSPSSVGPGARQGLLSRARQHVGHAGYLGGSLKLP